MQRPTSVTVFGILNIVFGLFGVFGLIASIALFFMPAGSNNPVVRIMHENPAYSAWLKICIPLGLLSCAALLAAGIGLLCLKSWARTLSIAYAIYAILFGLLGTAVNFIFLIAADARTSPTTTWAGSRRSHWRGDWRERRRMFRPDLSRPAAHLHVAPESGGGVPTARSAPDVRTISEGFRSSVPPSIRAGINASIPAFCTSHEGLFPNSREPKRHEDKADNPSARPPKSIRHSTPIRRRSRRSPVRARQRPFPPVGAAAVGRHTTVLACGAGPAP